MFFKRDKTSTAIIVPKQDWDDLQADVRGLKRLAELEGRERHEQDRRFAVAIDELETRVNALGEATGMSSEVHERSINLFSQRLGRMGERVAALEATREAETVTGGAATELQPEIVT